MIVQQLFDNTSSTFTYVLIEKVGGQAIIIDPIVENSDQYLALFTRLRLKLIIAIDTHTHADHISGLGMLRDLTRCAALMGEESNVCSVAIRVKDGDGITWKGNTIKAIHTPGHTDDSYSYLVDNYLFSGDTLLIGGTGRTDFQNGDPCAAYDSLFNKLLTLPDTTLVLPAHDYKGNTVSTIGYEKVHNPRLQVHSAQEYADMMNHLGLPNPKMMDIAILANTALGNDVSKYILPGEHIEAVQLIKDRKKDDKLLLIDIRETFECQRDGIIPDSISVPYSTFDQALQAGGILWQHLTASFDLSRIIIFCAFGVRSALAVDTIRRDGFAGVRHLHGGVSAWSKAGGELIPYSQKYW